MGSRLELRNVYKDFGSFRLDNVNLTLDAGEYFVLVGPTGSGKTLLLETVNGFHRVDYGIVLFDGLDVTDLPPAKRSVGYVPQTPNLNDRQTVRENIEFTVRLRGLPGDWSREINGVMEMMSLPASPRARSSRTPRMAASKAPFPRMRSCVAASGPSRLTWMCGLSSASVSAVLPSISTPFVLRVTSRALPA